jgi:nitroimidazol reductase NimA-like FMN-containing flavoprotein (pyridoxamine 5'-phosphate oxidase superfamily)
MAREMSPDEARSFLLGGTRTGKLAIARADGGPHVTPTWFTLDGDDLVLTTNGTSQKANAVSGELLVRITPTRVIAEADISG